MTYAAFARRLMRTGVAPDPWAQGRERFRQAPLILSAARCDAICAAAEQVARVHDAAVRICATHPELLEGFLGLTPVQQLLFRASQPRWHGVARADVFETTDGLAVCELNSDTPTGQPEAVVLGQLASEDHPDLVDPNAGMRERLLALVHHARRGLRPDAPQTAAIVYPTEITEDLHMIQLVHHWLESAGLAVVLGSPFNVASDRSGRVTVLGEPVGFLYRHYKTDWWTERLPVWADGEPYDDPEPLVEPLRAILAAEAEGLAAMINPFGAVVSQNKRLMALMWERMDLFPAELHPVIHRLVPRTLRLDGVDVERIAAERDHWVLKSDYGCEGDEVFVGALTPQAEWERALTHALPRRWVVQERFDPLRSEEGWVTNLGAWVFGGQRAGLYARIHQGATDDGALSVPVMVRRGASDR